MSALHAPEVERISKANDRKPCGVGVKRGLAAIRGSRRRVGEPGFPGNTYDHHTPAEQLKKVRKLCLDIGVESKIPVVTLGCGGVHTDNPRRSDHVPRHIQEQTDTASQVPSAADILVIFRRSS